MRVKLNYLGAAFSSILTCPLAASLTADSVLNFKQSEEQEDKEQNLDDLDKTDKRQMPRKYFMGLIFIMVVVSSVVISFNGQCQQYKYFYHHV